jgi:hypothetical protein
MQARQHFPGIETLAEQPVRDPETEVSLGFRSRSNIPPKFGFKQTKGKTFRMNARAAIVTLGVVSTGEGRAHRKLVQERQDFLTFASYS